MIMSKDISFDEIGYRITIDLLWVLSTEFSIFVDCYSERCIKRATSPHKMEWTMWVDLIITMEEADDYHNYKSEVNKCLVVIF